MLSTQTQDFNSIYREIGERGIVYACPPEAGHVARVTYKPYATWASTGEWTHLLPEGEYAVAVAAVAVAFPSDCS